MKKVFLSQPMHGLTDEEVLLARTDAMNKLMFAMREEFTVVDNFHHDEPPKDAGRLWHLGRSISLMDGVDLVVFLPGWNKARGCKVELETALQYGIDVLFL